MCVCLDATSVDSFDCVDHDTWERTHDRDYDSHHHDDSDEDVDDGTVAGIVFAIVLLLIVLGAIAACVVCFVCSVKTRPKRLVGFQGYPMDQMTSSRGAAGLAPVGTTQGRAAHGAMPAPPAYQTGAGIGGQVYAYDQKVHPDQMDGQTGSSTNQSNQGLTVSPPPSYMPPQTALPPTE